MAYEYVCEQCKTVFSRDENRSSRRYRFCSWACRYQGRPGLPGPDGCVRVPLTKGREALIDAEDAERLVRFSWSVNSHGYAVRTRGMNDPPGPRMIFMHRELVDVPAGMYGDHANGNTLDNRKANLRVATGTQNQANRRRGKNNRSGYMGVRWLNREQRWYA